MSRYFYDMMARDVDSRRYIVLYRESSLAAFILYADFYSFSAGDVTALYARIMRVPLDRWKVAVYLWYADSRNAYIDKLPILSTYVSNCVNFARAD